MATTTTTVRAACPHDCPDTCAMRVTVQDGRAIAVHGDPDHATTQGVLCTKVSRYTERTYHCERVLQPLKRIGPKGLGQFTPVSWSEALQAIAQKLGGIAVRSPQAIVPYSYAGTMGLVQGESMDRRFFNQLGASELDRTICSSAGSKALEVTYGNRIGMHLEHFVESRLILIWGSNAIASSVHFWRLAQIAKRQGAKLICIDPRKTETADKCHEHMALLPGTDGALALGLMHELIVHNWLDQDYIDQYTQGWPALRERALAWTPERTAIECGLQVSQVRQLAYDYAHTAPAAIRLNYGMQRVRGGGNAVRLIAILPCLIGAWRHRAGGLLLSSSGWFHKNTAALQQPQLRSQGPVRTLNMSTLGHDLNQASSAHFGPKIEALVVYNSNPVAVAPQSAQVVAGFAREDLFTVVLEHFLTDTADYADYVLPATTQLEHLDVHTSYGHTYALINEPAIAPMGLAKPNSQIFRELAAHMGFTAPCFLETDESIARSALGPSINFDQLRAEGWVKLSLPEAPLAQGGFATPNGKCLIDAPHWGVPDYTPNYESVRAAPELAENFPLAMISPPARNFLNSSFVNIKSLRDIEAEPVLELHPFDAAPRSIEHGALVRVFNARGQYHCKVRVSERARPGVVNGLGIWWRKLGVRGTNVNELTHQGLTDLGAGATFYDCLVQVQKA
jgi:anaerobic selenocysteine-containing dehydrogenase